MTLNRSSLSASLRVAVGLGLLLCPLAARAQTIVEVGGGWNYPGTGPSGVTYSHGWTARVSVGPQLASHFLLRIDGIMSQLVDSVQFYPPCPSTGCTHAYYNAETVNIVGVVANGILNVDRRGIFYLIGGAGAYDVNARDHELLVGLSAGAGIAVPIGARLRAVAEARWHGGRHDRTFLVRAHNVRPSLLKRRAARAGGLSSSSTPRSLLYTRS